MATKKEMAAWAANTKLQDMLQQIAVSAFNGRSEQVSEWLKIDRSLKAYKDRRLPGREGQQGDVGTGDRDVRTGRMDETQSGMDFLDDLNVPVLFLLLDTLEAQFNRLFFSSDTVWTYAGRTKDAERGAKALHSVVRAANDAFGNVGELLNLLRNSLKYKVGVTALGWNTVQEPIYTVHNGVKVKQLRKRLSGVDLTNISPYRMIRDQAVPWDRISNMRFIGHWRPISKHDVRRIYGVELTEADTYNWLFAPLDRSVNWAELFGLAGMDNSMTIEADLYVDLVPSEIGLKGRGADIPQVYHIVLCGWDKVLRCRPANIPVEKYPYRAWVPEGDGFDLNPLGRLDIVKDMQALFNWLFNTHLWAVRSSLDGNYVADPSIVDMQTVEQRNKSRRGNTFLINEEYWGIPGMTQQGLYQLPTNNSTVGHLEFGAQVVELMKLIVGTTDPIIGEDDPQSRRTAEEIASVRQAAGARIQLLANRFHTNFLRPLGYDVAKYTQDLLDHSCFVSLVGDDEDTYDKEVAFEDLLVDFKVSVGSNFISQDPAAKVQAWMQLVQLIFQNPQLAASFNLVTVLLELMKEQGITDADRFLSEGGILAAKSGSVAQTTPPQLLAAGGINGSAQTPTIPGAVGPGVSSVAAPPPGAGIAGMV